MDPQENANNSVLRQFTMERQGKRVVLYAGLLDLAHRQGLRRIKTELLQVPSEDNGQMAICAAEVETDRGTFSGIGDAGPSNVARAMLNCTIRMAETRAKARALRDAVNVGMTAVEEMGDFDDEPSPVAARVAAAEPTMRPVETSRAGVGRPPSSRDDEFPSATRAAPTATRTVATPLGPPVAERAANGQGQPTPIRSGGPAPTPAQWRMIERLIDEQDLSDGVVDSQLLVRWGVRHRDQMTRQQASELIDALKAKTL